MRVFFLMAPGCWKQDKANKVPERAELGLQSSCLQDLFPPSQPVEILTCIYTEPVPAGWSSLRLWPTWGCLVRPVQVPSTPCNPPLSAVWAPTSCHRNAVELGHPHYSIFPLILDVKRSRTAHECGPSKKLLQHLSPQQHAPSRCWFTEPWTLRSHTDSITARLHPHYKQNLFAFLYIYWRFWFLAGIHESSILAQTPWAVGR